MKDHLDAVKARLSGIAPTFLGWAVNESRYFVVTSPSWDESDERPVSTVSDALVTEVRVKAATGTFEGVVTMLRLAREELSPGGGASPLSVAGRSVSVRWIRSEFVDADVSATATATDLPRFVGVDTYRIVSQPVQE